MNLKESQPYSETEKRKFYKIVPIRISVHTVNTLLIKLSYMNFSKLTKSFLLFTEITQLLYMHIQWNLDLRNLYITKSLV